MDPISSAGIPTGGSRFFARAQEARKDPVPHQKAASARTLRTTGGKALADIRSTARGVTLSIPSRGADGFDAWINANAERLLAELHGQWATTRPEGSEETTGGTD